MRTVTGVATAALLWSVVGTQARRPAPALAQGDTVTLAFVGDVLMHDSLLVQAAEHADGPGFATLWSNISGGLASADVTYANLEGPVAEGVRCDGRTTDSPPPVTYANGTCGPGNGDSVYTGYPFFNAPPALLDALAAVGVDVVSTANNHALDRGSLGVVRTIEALDAAGLAHTGTRRPSDAGSLHAVTPVRKPGRTINVAWVACTYGTNGLQDGADLVTPCYEPSGAPSSGLLHTVHQLDLDPAVHAVVVTPHWGVEYRHEPNAAQERLADELVAAGATAVVGAHPHVIQPVRFVTYGGRTALAAFSLGNFVADQPDAQMRLGLLLYVDLATGDGGRLHVTDYRYVPLFMAHAPYAGPYRRALVVLDDGVPGDAAARARGVVRSVLGSGAQAALPTVPDPAPTSRRAAVRPTWSALRYWREPQFWPPHWR